MKNFFKVLSLLLLSLLAGCQFFSSMEEELTKNKDYDSEITSVTFSQTTLSVTTGDSEYLKVSLSPSGNQGKCNVKWEYDGDYVSCKTDNYGAIITGVKAGTTYIKASCNGIIATCLISVIASGDDASENPYIYSNYSVVQLQPGDATTITASLYGGTIEEMEDFVWSIKDDSIAEISYSRNNCVISALKPGSTQLTCHHPKATYDYSFVVYVYNDKLTETYITTDYNVLTIDKNNTDSQTISVDLVNPINAAYKNGFTWNYADEDSKSIIEITSNLNTAEIKPLKSGVAKIVVSHENSQYDLNIIVRVTTIVKNVYIGLTQSIVVIEGSETPYTVYASLENYDSYADPEGFSFEFPEGAEKLCDWTVSGNAVRLLGKKNGTFKIKVSNDLSEYSRNILVILQKQAGSAVDASMYITTDQNYVQTQVGKEPTSISVRLVGGVDGEDNIGEEDTNFSWYIKGGRDNGIVEVQQITGVVKDLDSLSRNAATSGESCIGELVINPLAAGELTVVVKHPRCLYETEIQVKVYDATALVNPKMITCADSLVRMINGQSTTVTASLRNQDDGDENNVEWSSADSSVISVSPATGITTQLSAVGSGSHQTYVTAHLDGALSDKKILVLSADTQADLDNMKGIYADSTYLRVSVDEVKTLSVEQFGLTSSDRVTWKAGDLTLVQVSGDSSSQFCASASVKGLKEGTTTVTASISGGSDVVFDVTVLPAGSSSEIFDESAGYLTTNLNAVVIENVGDSASLSVTGVNISDSDMQLYTTFSMEDVEGGEDGNVFTLSSSGGNATLTAERKGKSVIKVENKVSSLNSLSINAKCGELYEWTDDYIVYITTENDVVNIVNGEAVTIGAALVNTTSTGTFSWSVTQGGDKVEIIPTTSTCYIKGVEAGQAILTISNTLAGEVTKEVLINVANSDSELKGYKYLTTSQNVVTVGEESNTSVSVAIVNADENILTGYSWSSSNVSVCEVVGSGSIAVVYGKAIGTAKITVTNTDHCDYPLEIIVNVVDPVAAASDPYITCNNIVTCTVDDDPTTLAAELVGGYTGDETAFTWSIVDSSIATLYSSNDSAQIKALKEGVTQVIISHPKASVSRSVLVICEPAVTTNCYISLTESIIKMSPTDDSKTITATLVNGEDDDDYDFKWWADSYDKIDMNYTGASCVIDPISAGTVTIHVSHPKAASSKDIILYISNYTDFAFESSYVELETGSDTFINMEVPATGVDCDVSYKTSDASLCMVWGNSSVCTLSPGTVPDGYTSKSCTITATLQTKGGAVQATAQLLVSVTKKDETKPYIGLSDGSSTIITMNKDEVKNLSAQLYGTVTDTTSAGLTWTLNSGSGEFIVFNTSKKAGKTVQIKAVHAGKTTVTISHSEAKNPLTLYVIVAGEDEPSVSLNYETLPIEIGEDTQTLVATVKNDQGEELQWSVQNLTDPDSEEQDFFTFTTSGNKAFLYAENPGKAKVICTIPSNGAYAECTVDVSLSPSIEFFVYDDEGNFTYEDGVLVDKRNKYYINTLQLYPGQTKPLHWETVPAQDTIKQIQKGDTAYFDFSQDDKKNYGYLESWTDSSDPANPVTYHYPSGVGTIAVTGKTTEGTAYLKMETSSYQADSVSITNSYNYLFTVDKTLISSTPDLVRNNSEILTVNYEIRPACSKILITNLDRTSSYGSGLKLKGYEETKGDDGNIYWIIDTHTSTSETASTGIAKGTLQFEVDGEVNCSLSMRAVNYNLVSTGTSSVASNNFANNSLDVQVYYPKHTFTPVINKQVPTYNNGAFSDNAKVAQYSRYDSTTNTIFLGDGEFLSGNVTVDNADFTKVTIRSVTFDKSSSSSALSDKYSSTATGKKQYELVKISGGSGDTTNTHEFGLYHEKDYGLVVYRNSASAEWSWKSSSDSDVPTGIDQMYRLKTENDKTIENLNETVKESTYVGKLDVKYADFVTKKDAHYYIPVYVQVRNCPCAQDDLYDSYLTQVED